MGRSSECDQPKGPLKTVLNWGVVRFECGTRILRVILGRDARATHQTAILS